MKTYVALFPNAQVLDEQRRGNKLFSARFVLEGQELLVLNGGPHYRQTPAASLYVDCDDQAEVDRLWAALSEGGQPLQCGWLTDRFGVTWQIIPKRLPQLLRSPDGATAQRVLGAMMKMVKIDVATLEAAADG